MWLLKTRSAFIHVLFLQHVILEFHLLTAQPAAQEIVKAVTPAPAAITPQTWITVVLQVIIFLTTISGYIYMIYRENRNRRWDLQDREEARAAAAKRSEVVEQKVDKGIKVTSVVASQLADTREELGKKIDENTQLTISTAEDNASKIERITKRFLVEDGEPHGT